jgi:hypothetical protein
VVSFSESVRLKSKSGFRISKLQHLCLQTFDSKIKIRIHGPRSLLGVEKKTLLPGGEEYSRARSVYVPAGRAASERGPVAEQREQKAGGDKPAGGWVHDACRACTPAFGDRARRRVASHA